MRRSPCSSLDSSTSIATPPNNFSSLVLQQPRASAAFPSQSPRIGVRVRRVSMPWSIWAITLGQLLLNNYLALITTQINLFSSPSGPTTLTNGFSTNVSLFFTLSYQIPFSRLYCTSRDFVRVAFAS
jgi:hypothetical protein